MQASLRVPVQPTETPERVAAAVRQLFPGAALEPRPWGLEGPAGDLDRLGELVRAQRIPDAARAVMLRGRRGEVMRFTLGKQAAAAGKVSLAARPGPLGDIEVEVRAASEEALLALVDALAPDTRGWSLEDRGLTERGLQEQERAEAVLDGLERSADEGGDGRR